MTSTYVLYHGGCHDGFCAAWVLRNAIGMKQDNITYIPVQYGQPPPGIQKEANLYILDFCYPREVLTNWLTGPNAVRFMAVIDHHKTAMKDLEGFKEEMVSTHGIDPSIVFDMDKSGARLTWEYFYGAAKVPWLVDYTEDRDLWRWRLAESRAINAALRSYPLTFEQFDAFHKMMTPINDLAREGQAILRYQQQVIDIHVSHATEIDMDGHKILAVNATTLFSEIAGELAKDHPFGACYFITANGKTKTTYSKVWSLRSTEDGIDVSEIAKAHGGGGHKHAAGFQE